MRKDAKVMFAVGGVLLAVLVVYFVSTSKKKTTTPSPVAVTTPPADAATVAPVAPAADPIPVPPTVPPTETTSLPPTPAPGAERTALPAGSRQDPIPSEAEKPATETHHADKPDDNGNNGVALAKPHGPYTVYVVKPNENYTTISLARYGTSRHWVEIKEANPTIDPKKLHVGDKINLPELAVAKADPDLVPGTPNVIPLEEQQSPLLISSETGGVGTVPLPPPSTVVAGPGPAPVPGQTYTVRPGDSLYKISKRVYKTGSKADAIYEANKALIGPDKAKLKLGMKLMIPAISAAAPAASDAAR